MSRHSEPVRACRAHLGTAVGDPRCPNVIAAERVMCGACWSLVPMDIRRRVYEVYEPGFVAASSPPPEWTAAVEEALLAVAEIHGRTAQGKGGGVRHDRTPPELKTGS